MFSLSYAGCTTNATWFPLMDLTEGRLRQSCPHKRAHHAQAAVCALEAIVDKLDDASADCLQAEYRFLQDAVERPLRRNGIAWIVFTGGQCGPSKQLTLQCLCRLVFRTLSANMASLHMAQTLAKIVHDRALPLWYHPTFVALLPLVPRGDMGRLQDWYANYEFQARAQHALLFGLHDADAGNAADEQQQPGSGAGSFTDRPPARPGGGGDSVSRHRGRSAPYRGAVVFKQANGGGRALAP